MFEHNEVLLPNMSGKVSFEGNPVRAIGFDSLNTNKILQTVSIYTTNFTGRVYLYGTLALNPTDNDWAIIPLTDETDYIEFNHLYDGKSKKDNRCINVKGSYTWLKAKMDRDYIDDSLYTNVYSNGSTPITSYNIDSDDSMPYLPQKEVVTKIPSYMLSNYGNIESILLTY